MRKSLQLKGLVSVAVGLVLVIPAALHAESPPEVGGELIKWVTNYATAYQAADREKKMLFILFTEENRTPAWREFEDSTLKHADVVSRLNKVVCAKLPLDAEVVVQGKPTRVLEHLSFREMLGRPGIAVVDLATDDQEIRGHVVSTFPFDQEAPYSVGKLTAILDLPEGTLTQRTLIFAVRTHPEAPRSTKGKLMSFLAQEAENHSSHQARIRVQGHHNWESRFHRITGRLPGGLRAQEVCAESWPHQGLLEAAIDCVHSWRQSPGHWSAVSSDQEAYGYDMKRGSNGIWYATGIFGNLR
jgi:hypothetical protein